MDIPFLAYSLEELPFIIISLVIAFTVHEYAHAYMAYKFGDPTAKNQGRLTLSPLAHLDPFGTLLLLIAGFGWARPVPVNRFFFKNPRLAGIMVSVAGPLSNLLLAFVGMIIYFTLQNAGLGYDNFFVILFSTFISLNVLLFVFNMLPFPPLDGYRIIEDLAPDRIRPKLTQFESYSIIIFLVLVVTPLSDYTIQPIFNVVIPFVLQTMSMILSPIFG